MKFWPVPNSYSKEVPISGAGSFAESRGSRHHYAVDIYAPVSSKVLATENGKVIAEGVFTTPAVKSYWNMTYFVAIKHDSGYIAKYCELGDLLVNKGDQVKGGEVIGHIGKVLNFKEINSQSPLYIQKIKEAEVEGMLHFELYKEEPVIFRDYNGGNWHNHQKPDNILDPTTYLSSL
ncbi:MAG: M23 family metallopeptidase [Bacteroidales bacterium]